MLPHLGHDFFNAFSVAVPTTCARQTGVPMGCLVSSEEQHPSTLQSFDTRVLKKRVISLGRLASPSQCGVSDCPDIPDVSSCRPTCLRVNNIEGFTPTVFLPDKIVVIRGIS